MMKRQWLDRYVFALFVIGLCATAFLGGSLALHYKLPPSKFFQDAFTAADAWWEALRPPATAPLELGENQAQINESIINYPLLEKWNRRRAENGYTLVSTGFMDAAWLVDMEGKIVHRWDMPFKKAWPEANHVHRLATATTFMNTAYALPNGDLIVQYSALGDTPYGYGIVKLDKDSNLLWKYSENAHHDFYVDRHNGDIYALIHTMMKDPPEEMEKFSYPMLVDYIVRLSPNGEEQDRISIFDAFRDTPFELMLYHARNSGLANWDHFHTNSITKLEPEMAAAFPMFKPGSLMISVRSMNALAVIDPQTRKVVWAFDGGWRAQHAGHFLSDGTILLYDNRGHFEDGKTWSRLIAFDPKTLAVKWHYTGNTNRPFFSVIIGRVQALPGGNFLVNESMPARIFEITPEGETVWSYRLQRAKRRDPTLNAIITSRRYRESDLPFLGKNVE